MTQSNPLVAPLRVMAVIFSVGVGGYLVWAAQKRQGPAPESDPGAGGQALEVSTEPSHFDPSGAVGPRDQLDQDTAQQGSDPAKVFLPSSKNAFQRGQLWPLLESHPLPGAAEAASGDSATNVDPVLLFSSKSAPINPEILEATSNEADVEFEPQPRFLPSSKVIITPEMMPKPEDPVFLSSSKSAPLHLIEPQTKETQPNEPAEEATDKPTKQSGGSRP
jgi:hypothetical protein